MAQTFNKIYRAHLVEQYGKEEFAILPALANTLFQKIATPLSTGGVTYQIQRFKRLKAKAFDAAASYDNAVNALKSFDTLEWDTIVHTVNTARVVGLAHGVNDNLWVSENQANTNYVIGQAVHALAATRVEDVITEAISGKAVNAVTTTGMWDDIADSISTVTTFVDEFKHGVDRSNLVILINPHAADELAKQKGQVFRNETPVFGKGFTAKENVNSVPVLRVPGLNKFSLGTGTAARRVAYILMDIDSIAFNTYDSGFSTQQHGPLSFSGNYFYDLIKRIDGDRVIVKTFATNPGTETVKANT